MKLPKNFKTKWVNALMSGEYEQGRAHLYLNQKYCCLGVAGRVARISCYDLCAEGFLEDIKGVNKVPAVLRGRGDAPKGLARLNDARVPFEVIAGFIHENL